MSARVFSRFAMSEARAPRGSPPGPEIERARRALFSPHNCAQARQFVETELANYRRQKSEHFNFDFEKGMPMETEDARFKWKRVNSADSIPEAYAMERLPFLNAHADSVSESSIEASTASSDSTIRTRSRQSSITEYMPKRKNASSTSCPPSKQGAKSAVLDSPSDPPAKKQKTTSS